MAEWLEISEKYKRVNPFRFNFQLLKSLFLFRLLKSGLQNWQQDYLKPTGLPPLIHMGHLKVSCGSGCCGKMKLVVINLIHQVLVTLGTLLTVYIYSFILSWNVFTTSLLLKSASYKFTITIT